MSYPLERITWLDAAFMERADQDDEFEPVECNTVGYVIRDTPDTDGVYVVLAGEISEGGAHDFRWVTTIPAGMITHREELAQKATLTTATL